MLIGTGSDDVAVRFTLARELAYQNGGGLPLYVLDHKPVGAFPVVSYDPMVKFPTVAAGLQQISRDFRLVYDPHTKALDWPEHRGIHLYTNFCGLMLHEASCQVDMDKGWPHGTPCSPVMAWNGRGIVAWAKAHDKARFHTDPTRLQKQINKARGEYNDGKREMFDKEAREMDAYCLNELRNVTNQITVGFSQCDNLKLKPQKAKSSRSSQAVA